ncbi:type II restriction endonuclease [Ramlibacter sp.]|uniref:type II restriction endonuclease n=1 Tax=Ramlibacter sp. TaxID=1917967 RepID=UPI002D3D6A52|nr:type II restriction endonuclease [Ramlibacter sp.]HYD77547.1 type II restriction endonuclease [Ramlibacter sp.]
MKKGYLSEYFTGVAAKRLKAVEADVLRSNQHEFNGVDALKRLFGHASGKQTFPAKFIYLSDAQDEPVIADGFLTWYDARERHPVRSEHRLYFPSTPVSERSGTGDLLIIGRRPDASVLVVVADAGSTAANQIQWLFGVDDLADAGYAVREVLDAERDRIAFASRLILESVGVTLEEDSDDGLDEILDRFSGFPTTREFSAFARAKAPQVDVESDCDAALMAWMDKEEKLFRALERHLIADRLSKGFQGDVDAFIAFSLSVQNRRKSRVGYALENHLEHVFTTLKVPFVRTPVTENKAKPDFLFPGISEYRDPSFDPVRLTMLGVKSTCKDRWRQVLSEADRVPEKHLLTLETAISTAQTDEMKDKHLQLVVPRQLHATYTPPQQKWLVDLHGLVERVKAQLSVH